MGEASGLRDSALTVAGFAEDAKVGVGLGAVVEAEDGFDGADEFCWAE